MKKVLLLFCLIIFIAFGPSCFSFEPSDVVYNNEKVMYDIDNQVWHDTIVKPQKPVTTEVVEEYADAEEELDDEADGMSLNTVVLTKKTTSGIYKNSFLVSEDKQVVLELTSNYEFLKDGKLIAVDNSRLKYYQVIYEDEQFVQVPLSDDELMQIFPKTQIVKISEFKNDKLEVTRPFFRVKRLLLVNDTDREFFKYTYKHPRVQFCEIKGLVKSYRYEKIKFSHYGDNEGALTIVIKR